MSKTSSQSPWKQIRGLIILLISSMVCAGGVVGYLIYTYGPTGQYIVKNVLLSPELMAQVGQNGRLSPKLRFHGIEFLYTDSNDRSFHRMPVGHEAYATVYKWIASQKSLDEVPEAVYQQFIGEEVSRLVLLVKDERRAGTAATRTFQEVQFGREGDYFRTELRTDDPNDSWAYFRLPGIGPRVMDLLKDRS